jgi:hypothetical protein
VVVDECGAIVVATSGRDGDRSRGGVVFKWFFLGFSLSSFICFLLFLFFSSPPSCDDNHQATPHDSLHVSIDSIIKSRAEKFKETLNGITQDI